MKNSYCINYFCSAAQRCATRTVQCPQCNTKKTELSNKLKHRIKIWLWTLALTQSQETLKSQNVIFRDHQQSFNTLLSKNDLGGRRSNPHQEHFHLSRYNTSKNIKPWKYSREDQSTQVSKRNDLLLALIWLQFEFQSKTKILKLSYLFDNELQYQRRLQYELFRWKKWSPFSWHISETLVVQGDK